MNFNPYNLYQRALRSRWKWLIIIVTLVYFISPIDVFSELIIPLLGYIDDGLLLGILVRELFLISHEENSIEKTKKNTTIDVEPTKKQ